MAIQKHLKKNSSVKVSITGTSSDGKGVGKTDDGLTVFVANGAVGDILRAHIIKVKKNFAVGKIEEILIPSPSRIPVDCVNFPKCGGCVFRHISYSAELEIKSQAVLDAVTRIGGLKVEGYKKSSDAGPKTDAFTHSWCKELGGESYASGSIIRPIVGAETINSYRNKAQMPIGRDNDGEPLIGYYASHSHRIVDCKNCLLQPEIFDSVSETVKEFIKDTDQEIYDEKTRTGVLRHLYIRRGEAFGEIMVCLVINKHKLKSEKLLVDRIRRNIPQVKTIAVNLNDEDTNVILGPKTRVLWGEDTITDVLCGLKIILSPASFYQVNRKQAEKLYQIAAEYAKLDKDKILLDLYCGTGTIGLTMAKMCKKLIGAEIVHEAVENAKRNAKINGIDNAEFIEGDARFALEQLINRGIHPDVIILDPPRKGCSEDAINIIVKMSPERIVYVSCDPATLARDLKIFETRGFAAREITPVDLFPRTAHVETVVLLTHKKPNSYINRSRGA